MTCRRMKIVVYNRRMSYERDALDEITERTRKYWIS